MIIIKYFFFMTVDSTDQVFTNEPRWGTSRSSNRQSYASRLCERADAFSKTRAGAHSHLTILP